MSIFKNKIALGTGVILVFALVFTVFMVKGKDKSSASGFTNQTMMQGFEWNLAPSGTHWNDLSEKADELSELGVTSLWLPPAYKASSAMDNGYSTYDLYDLGEFNQKGSIRTKYGTKDQYLSLINKLHANGIKVYGDIVLNHKGSADEKATVSAVKVDPTDRTSVISDPADIQAWCVFNFPGRNGKYSTFTWNASHFDGVDWDQLTSKSAIYRFADKTWDPDVSTENGNYDYLMFADVDLQNSEVISELNSWGKWYVNTASLDGVRLDAVKHMSSSFYKQWLRSVRRSTQKCLPSIGEYYSGNLDELTGYLEDTSYTTSLFDFPLHYNFRDAGNDGASYDLSTLFDNTLVGSNPCYAVTLVDNHDTQPGQSTSYVAPTFKGQAYTSILTREDGLPCVFYGDYYGTRDGKTASIKPQLDKLMLARKYCAYGTQYDYVNDADVIGWTRVGTYANKYYGLAAVISDSVAGTKKMYVGKRHAGETWVDVTGNITDTVTISSSGYATFAVKATSYSVWTSKEAADVISASLDKVAAKSTYTIPENNTVTLYYKTSWTKAYMHYQVGSGAWTSAPGVKMSNTNLDNYKTITIDLKDQAFVTGCFNNGSSEWESNLGANYTLRAGTYYISDTIVYEGTPSGYDSSATAIPEPTETPVASASGTSSSVTVYYYTGWTAPYVHYSVGGTWTTAPGKALTATDVASYFTYTFDLGSSTSVTMCFNDGGSNWDSCNGSNYTLTGGTYIIKDGVATAGTLSDIATE